MRHGRSIGHIFYAVTLSYIYLLGLTGCSSGNNEGLTIITSSLPNGTVNESYSAALSGSGGLPLIPSASCSKNSHVDHQYAPGPAVDYNHLAPCRDCWRAL